jgi:hypothetical protein
MRFKIILYFFISLVIIDLIIINYFLFTNRSPQNPASPSPAPDLSVLTDRVSRLESTVISLQSATPVPTLSAARAPLPTGAKHVTYLPINGQFNQLSYDWVDVPTSSFYFDTKDYPGLVSVTFEANIKLFNGNGFAFARLYDVTHSAPIPGSQVQTGSQLDTIVTSNPLTFLDGRNLIKVQIKSLTADTTYFNSARLIITSKF